MNTMDFENVVYDLIEAYAEKYPNGKTNESLQWAAERLHEAVETAVEDYAQDNGIEYESVY